MRTGQVAGCRRQVGRSVAQPGSALASGARGREFESPRSDQHLRAHTTTGPGNGRACVRAQNRGGPRGRSLSPRRRDCNARSGGPGPPFFDFFTAVGLPENPIAKTSARANCMAKAARRPWRGMSLAQAKVSPLVQAIVPPPCAPAGGAGAAPWPAHHATFSKATRSAGGGPRRRRRTNASGRLGRFGQKPGCGHLQACFRRPLPHAAWQRRVNASAGEGTEQGHCRCGCGSKRCRGPLRSAGVQQTAKARTRGAMVSPRLRVQLAPPWWRERWQDFLTTDDSLLQSGTAQETARNQPGVEAFS
jgi:hypothetical protein